ncbi:ribonuclease H-like domain-containing protein [Cohnella suwonensis]|uniref:Ribonuclease H-like domain-containing protein n=1 Tax=Cohnella suwonensis TaxID=696072 RepID=A0ABW0LP05_9BACL
MSGGLRERLGRLRGVSPAEGTPEADIGTANMESVADRGGADASMEGPDVSEVGAETIPEGFRQLGIDSERTEFGSFLLRKIRYPYPYRHGTYDLSELSSLTGYLSPVAHRQNKETETGQPLDVSRLLFLDTETTGLGVGAGNVPFMIGFGYCEDDAFVVEQALIRHPGEEKAMLAYLLDKMGGRSHLVTYNGRTFDWPVLVNRFILNGWRKNGAEPAHLDFLHPSRALWRNTLASCRLATVEVERLGFVREDDVPGSLAPALYFRYLSDGDPEHLRGVFLHNEKDILTLASLCVHFGVLLSERDMESHANEAGSEELYRTACWLELHGKADVAERLFARLAEREDAGDGGWGLALAARYKKAGRHGLALPLWKQAADRAEHSAAPKLEAHLELAIYYEHRDKQPGVAVRYAENALELVHRRAKLGTNAAKMREEKEAWQRRLARLREKAARLSDREKE